MKAPIYILTLILCISCQSNTEQKDKKSDHSIEQNAQMEPDETITTTQYCFLSLLGSDANYQDSTIVQFTIDGINVTGTYDWIPAEKDSARGKLSGTISGDIITAIYDYMIEGSNQQEEMIFKLTADKLLVKRGELQEVDGVLKLKYPKNAKFTEVIAKVDCK